MERVLATSPALVASYLDQPHFDLRALSRLVPARPACSLPFPRQCLPLLEQLEVAQSLQRSVRAERIHQQGHIALCGHNRRSGHAFAKHHHGELRHVQRLGPCWHRLQQHQWDSDLRSRAGSTNYFEVPILDAGHHGALTVNLALSSPTNTDLGSLADATLTILHDGTSGDKTTSVSLTASDTSPIFSEPVTFTSVVSPAPHGHKVPTGDVEYFDGATLLGVGAIDSGGTASFTTMTLAGGSHSITAQYSGDNDYASSTSSALTETVDVDPATTTTLYPASPNPSVFGQAVRFIALVCAGAPRHGHADRLGVLHVRQHNAGQRYLERRLRHLHNLHPVRGHAEHHRRLSGLRLFHGQLLRGHHPDGEQGQHLRPRWPAALSRPSLARRQPSRPPSASPRPGRLRLRDLCPSSTARPRWAPKR